MDTRPTNSSAAGPMTPRPFRVMRSRDETRDTVTLSLEPEDGVPLAFQPGQFTMLYAFGVGEIPVSVSGTAEGGGPLVQTIRAVGAVSQALCSARRGAVVGVRGPYGTGWPVQALEG